MSEPIAAGKHMDDKTHDDEREDLILVAHFYIARLFRIEKKCKDIVGSLTTPHSHGQETLHEKAYKTLRGSNNNQTGRSEQVGVGTYVK